MRNLSDILKAGFHMVVPIVPIASKYIQLTGKTAIGNRPVVRIVYGSVSMKLVSL